MGGGGESNIRGVEHGLAHADEIRNGWRQCRILVHGLITILHHTGCEAGSQNNTVDHHLEGSLGQVVVVGLSIGCWGSSRPVEVEDQVHPHFGSCCSVAQLRPCQPRRRVHLRRPCMGFQATRMSHPLARLEHHQVEDHFAQCFGFQRSFANLDRIAAAAFDSR